MAKAEMKTSMSTQVKKVEEEVFVLRLSREEAKSLKALTGAGRSGGQGRGTTWDHTDSIFKALSSVGIGLVWSGARFDFDSRGFIGKKLPN